MGRRAVVTIVVAVVSALATLGGPTLPAAGADAPPAKFAGLDAATGTPRWNVTVGSDSVGVLTTPYVANGVAIVTRQQCRRSGGAYRRGDISIVVLDVRTGRTLWTRADASVAFTVSQLGYRSPTPIVPLTLTNGDLVAVNVRTGKQQWTLRGAGSAERSPIDVGTQVVGTVGDVMLRIVGKVGAPPQLAAYDLRTGKVRWQVEGEAAFSSYATTDGRDLFTVPQRAPGQQQTVTLQQRSLATGEVTATEDYAASEASEAIVASHVAVDAAHLVVAVQQAPIHVVVFDRASRTQAWRAEGQFELVAGERVLVDHVNGPWSLVALDAATGAPAWQVDQGWGASLVDGGRVALNVGPVGDAASRGTVRDLGGGDEVWSRATAPSAVVRGAGTTVLAGSNGCVPAVATDTK